METKKGYKWTSLQNRGRVTDVENKVQCQFKSSCIWAAPPGKQRVELRGDQINTPQGWGDEGTSEDTRLKCQAHLLALKDAYKQRTGAEKENEGRCAAQSRGKTLQSELYKCPWNHRPEQYKHTSGCDPEGEEEKPPWELGFSFPQPGTWEV